MNCITYGFILGITKKKPGLIVSQCDKQILYLTNKTSYFQLKKKKAEKVFVSHDYPNCSNIRSTVRRELC